MLLINIRKYNLSYELVFFWYNILNIKIILETIYNEIQKNYLQIIYTNISIYLFYYIKFDIINYSFAKVNYIVLHINTYYIYYIIHHFEYIEKAYHFNSI